MHVLKLLWEFSNFNIHKFIKNHHHRCVLPNGRSVTALTGTKAAFLLKAGLSPQTQEPRLQFYQGWTSVVASHCFPHPTLSLASECTFKDLKRSQGYQRGGEGSWIWLTGLSGLHWNSPQGLNISSIRVFDQIRDPEIPITLHPLIKKANLFLLKIKERPNSYITLKNMIFCRICIELWY